MTPTARRIRSAVRAVFYTVCALALVLLGSVDWFPA